MGTGKSYIGVGLDEAHRAIDPTGGRTLVTCPLPVTEKWGDLFAEEGYRVSICNPKDRTAFLERKADVYIVHWQAIRLLQLQLQRGKWFHSIGDEIQAIQTRKAQTTTAFKKIKASHKTGLSGGPITNTPDKLWSVLNWIDKKSYASYWRFRNDYIEEEVDHFGYKHIVGPKNTDRLLRQIDPIYMRKLKSEVLPDLPEKYYTTLRVDLLPKQRRAYEDMKKRMIAWVGADENSPLVSPVVIAQLVRLQQFAEAYCEINDFNKVRLSEPSSKLDLLEEIVLSNPGKPFVVFSQSEQMIRLAETRLQRIAISTLSLTGQTPQERRADWRLFQAGEAQVFLGTITAGGVAIDLFAADTVIFLDRSWSPFDNEQAEDRLHRMGQKNAVHIIDIEARDTIDQRRKVRIQLKRSWLRQMLGDV